MTSPITPDTVRALIAGTTSGDWRSSWGDPAGGDDAPLIYSESGPVCASMWYDGPRVACTEADAALMAASKRIALAYLDAVSERDRLREIADDSPPPADAGLLALANRTLAADLETVRAERDRLARVIAVEGGDEAAAPEGWDWDRACAWWRRGSARVRRHAEGNEHGWHWLSSPDPYGPSGSAKTALEAMEAADRAGGSDV